MDPLGKYFPTYKDICPHCGTGVQFLSVDLHQRDGSEISARLQSINGEFRPAKASVPSVTFALCPACSKIIVQLRSDEQKPPALIHPRTGLRRPVHPAVPDELLADYQEAVLVLQDSPKASAALSRRCLQHLLIRQGAKKKNLYDQLLELYDTLPAYVQTFVDNIRKLGNLAAHPKNDTETDRILDVEPGEADWMLELLEELFDHYFAKPAEALERQKKLADRLSKAANPQPGS